MKVSRKAAAWLCAMVMAATPAAAFSVSAEEGTSSDAAVSAQTESGTVKYGKVTEVNGSKVKVALGEFAKKQRPASDTAEGESTEKSKKSGEHSRKKAASADTEDQSGTEVSDTAKENKGGRCGGKKGRKGGRSGKFTENGETLTVDVTEDVTVTQKGEEVTAADISLGDMLKLSYNDSDELTGVKISDGHKHRGNSGKQPKTSPSESAAEQTSEA